MINQNFFVVGYMHSGTTLLQKVISNHSKVFTPPCETKFLEYEKSIKKKINNMNDSKVVDYFLRIIFYGVDFHKYYQNSIEIPEYIESQKDKFKIEKIPLRELFFKFLDRCSKLNNKSCVLEKSPNNLYFFDEILEILPNAKFVGIIRDPRDVVASKKTRYINVDKNKYNQKDIKLKRLEKQFSVIIDCLSWRSTSKFYQRKSNDERIHIVKYEQLVNNPETEFKKILSFLDLKFEKNILKTEFSNSADLNNDKIIGITNRSVGRYKKVLNKYEIKIIEWLCKKEFSKYGWSINKNNHINIYDVFSIAAIVVLTPIQIIKRLFYRYKMLGKINFIDFLKISIKKIKSI